MGWFLSLGIFDVEIAVHSVRHLPDQGATAHQVVTAAATHIVAMGAGRPAVECPLMFAAGTQADTDIARVEVARLRVNQGRAPPAARFEPAQRFWILTDR